MTGQAVDKVDFNGRFSAEVRAELARSKTSAKALAPLLGISETAVYRRLNGDTGWPLDDAMTVARHLGVSLTRLTVEAAA